jgi:hypothetical protein
MKPTIIMLLAFIFLNSCKNVEESKNETLATQDSTINTEVTNVEDNASKVIEDNTNSIPKDSQNDWYWENTQMSQNDVFENWEHGPVDLVMLYRYKNNQNTPTKLTVGSIDENGTITINLPETIQTETKLGNLKNLVFYDIQDISKFIYTNPDVGYFGKTTLNVEKNGATIGTLTMGNSVRVTYNLTNQSTLTMGDEGYLISWVYLDRAARILGTENTTNTVRRDGTNSIEAENTVVYKLEYKSGWNLVKTEVIGKYDLDHERGLNASWFKKHEHTVVAEIPEDANYFFRKRDD